MLDRPLLETFAFAALACAAAFADAQTTAPTPIADNGIVRVKSAYPVDETVARLKADIAAKGIRFFAEIDQSRLAADAGITLRRSTLLEFGNPPLGTQFITGNADAGLDWPVRLRVTQDDAGQVWAVYTAPTLTSFAAPQGGPCGGPAKPDPRKTLVGPAS